MSKLSQLIAELCPNGVEYIAIEKLLKYEQPTQFFVESENYDNSYKTPVLTAGQSFILGYTDENNGIYQASIDKPVIIFDDFTTSFHWVDFNFKVKSSAMKILTPTDGNLTTFRYLFYIMKSINYQPASHSRQWISKYSKFKIPLPPISIQQEIVRILDNFTELSTEISTALSTELVARKKQYQYYRDTLLTFDNNVPRVKLGEIAEIGTGGSNTNEGLEVGKYPFFVRSQEIKYKNSFEFDETAIITSGDGVGVGKIFHFIEGKYALHQRAYRIKITNEKVLPIYFYYFMKSTFENYIKRKFFHSSVTSIRKPMLNSFPVFIPPLAEQQRIVDILDRFDTLVNNISIGIPAEIEARDKQYQYYRNKLLIFSRLKEEL